MKRLMMLSALVALVAPAFAAASYEWTGSGRANDWTDENNYDPVGHPGEGDAVVIPADTTVTLSSTDAASWQVTDRLAKINPSTDTSVVEIDVPSGTKALKCGVANGKQKGLLVKKGNGLLQLDRYDNPNSDYYVSLRVEEGTLRAPTNNSAKSSTSYLFGDVEVCTNATFFAAMCGNNVTCPLTILTSLTGSGVVTNDTTYQFGGQVMVVGDGPECTFDGRIGGRIRFVSDARVKLMGTNSTTFARNNDVMSAGNNMGRFENGPMVSFVKLGNRGEPSSVGSGDMQFYSRKADDCAGMFRYLGTGESSDKDFTLCGPALYPSLLDAGPNGGLTLTGGFKISTSTAQNHALILAGDNATEAGICTMAGPIVDAVSGETSCIITNIVKRGAGTWRFADNADRTWSGRLTVEAGKVQFDSLAPVGTICSLGTAQNATPYSTLLLGGTLEYVGTSAQPATDRTLGVGGNATLRNASGRALTMANVSAAVDGAVLTLDGAEGTENVLADVADGEGSLSIRKTGAGTWRLQGNQTFSGDLTVEDGTLVVEQPRYEWYRMSFRHTISNIVSFCVNEVGLYDADGRRQNDGLKDATAGGLENLEAGELYLYRKTYFSAVAIESLFDDTTSEWRAYQKGDDGKSQYLQHDLTNTWVRFVMRPKAGSLPITSFDVVIGGTKGDKGLTMSVDDYLLEASVDGKVWDTVCETNKLYQQLDCWQQWFFKEKSYANGDAAEHVTGCPIAPRPNVAMPVQLNGCRVSVAEGATLKARAGDTITVSKLCVSATSAGTLENVILAEDGVLDVMDVPKGVAVVELPLKFVGTDPAAVGGWTFTVNGKPSGSWKLSVENGKLVLRRGGLILIFR